MYALNMMRISLELATRNHVYESTATKFFEHFLAIAAAMMQQNGRRGLWDEVDQFYHNVLRRPDGSVIPLRLFSLVGLFPLFAVEVLEPGTLDTLPGIRRTPAMGAGPPPGSRRAGVALGCGRAGVTAAAVAVARPPHEGPAAADAG